MCFIFPLACLECGSWSGHKHGSISFYFAEKSIPSFTYSNCFIIRTMPALRFSLHLGLVGLFLTIAKNYLCVSFLAQRVKASPLIGEPPAVNNAALTHTHTRFHVCVHAEEKALASSYFTSKKHQLSLKHNIQPDCFGKTSPLMSDVQYFTDFIYDKSN